MDPLAALVSLGEDEKRSRGLVYTPAEILQQPQTWRRSYQNVLHLSHRLEKFLNFTGVEYGAGNFLTVFLVGAGTSDYIGKSLCTLLQKKWSCDVHAIPSTDLLTNVDDYLIPGRNYLWISFSRSGDSSEGVAVLDAARKRYPNVKHLIVTCNANGQMARLFAEDEKFFRVILNDEVNDRGLAMTSSFSNMVVVGQALANLRDLQAYNSILDRLVEAATEFLPVAANTCEQLVAEGFTKICFLGSGALKGAATESALKVLELTNGRVTSFSESFLGLRHGPLSAIDSNTLLVNFLSGDTRTRSFELDLVREVSEKRLTDKCLLVFPGRPQQMIGIPETNSLFLGLEPKVDDAYLPPVDVITGQLLGLFASLREGFLPDTPSPRGALSRVVSHVTIY